MLKIKSKAFKFLIGTFAVVALAFAMNTYAAVDLGPTTLKVGSTGSYVMTLQTVVGATPVDGVFGPMTKAKVMAWQANNGLTADGIVGPATKAAMNGTTTPVTEVPGCPAGAAFNYLTGAPCVTTPVTEVPGCPAGALFNYMTGASCAGATTPVTGALTGSQGDISVTDFSSGTEQTIGEGGSEKVLGVYVEADNGSDVDVSSFKVELKDGAGDGSTRLERYIDSVDVYMGSTKVGSADVDEFSKDSTTYTKAISLSGAIVEKGEKVKFYVVLNANSVIYSDDIGNTWDVDVTSVRFQDAMGVIMTYAGTDVAVDAVNVDFEDSTANDEISTLSASSNPDAATLLVKDTGVSDEYMVFAFRLKADSDSTDLNVLEIPITVVPGAADADEVVSDIYLKVGSTVYDDYSYAAGIYTFTMDEGELEVEAGETITVEVYTEFMKEGLGTTYTTGETVTFSLDASELIVENVDGDSVETSGLTNRSGNEMVLSTTVANVSNLSWTVASTGTMVDFFFTVEADNEDFDVLAADVDDAIAAGSTAVVVEGATFMTDIKGTLTRYSGDSVVTLGGNTGYTVAAGDETTFRVRYTLGSDATTPVVAADNGKWLEVKVTSVAGQPVPDNKMTSPTATVNL
ncbi:MAG: peptidoglycan-binding domain-containing protein [Candidatus Pacebacteria bacterium]|nr:peptidoglycan-binding domain-containing protein [Candidatus Paceibacterota bacterium]